MTRFRTIKFREVRGAGRGRAVAARVRKRFSRPGLRARTRAAARIPTSGGGYVAGPAAGAGRLASVRFRVLKRLFAPGSNWAGAARDVRLETGTQARLSPSGLVLPCSFG